MLICLRMSFSDLVGLFQEVELGVKVWAVVWFLIMWHVKEKSSSWLIFLDDLNRASSNRGSRRSICKFSVPRWTRHSGWCHLAALHAEQTHTHTHAQSETLTWLCAAHVTSWGEREGKKERERDVRDRAVQLVAGEGQQTVSGSRPRRWPDRDRGSLSSGKFWIQHSVVWFTSPGPDPEF